MAHGYIVTIEDGSRFTLDDQALVERVFSPVERHVLDNALVFGEADPLLRYYASGPIDRIESRLSSPVMASLATPSKQVVLLPLPE